MRRVNKEYLQQLAAEAASQYLNTPEKSLSKIVAEIAQRELLPPAAINRLVELTNRAVFLEVFARNPDKTFEFPIARVEDVEAYLRGESPESDKDLPPETSDFNDEDYILTPREQLALKSAPFKLNDMGEITQLIKETKQQLEEKLKQKGFRVARFAVTLVKQAAAKAQQQNAQLKEVERQLKEVIRQMKRAGMTRSDFSKLLSQLGVSQKDRQYLMKLFEKTAEAEQPPRPKASTEKYIRFAKLATETTQNPHKLVKLVKLAKWLEPTEALRHVKTYSGGDKDAMYAAIKAFEVIHERSLASWRDKIRPTIHKFASLAKQRRELIKEASKTLEEFAQILSSTEQLPAEGKAAVTSALAPYKTLINDLMRQVKE